MGTYDTLFGEKLVVIVNQITPYMPKTLSEDSIRYIARDILLEVNAIEFTKPQYKGISK